MLIRSQDNKILTDDLNIRIDKNYVGLDRSLGDVHKGYEIRNKMGILGIYETEEKAIKVLDEIVDLFEEPIEHFRANSEITDEFRFKTYQMPAEEELEDEED